MIAHPRTLIGAALSRARQRLVDHVTARIDGFLMTPPKQRPRPLPKPRLGVMAAKTPTPKPKLWLVQPVPKMTSKARH